ncbi:MAG TPA: hypothetical protein PKM73_08055 [Verrucomicrobiota bacterium]|nr:hypothetical protein [Verrucomicrobiota bacterium]HNU51785.1 hypothetical protein [Verrucomicrobiota bacterium]
MTETVTSETDKSQVPEVQSGIASARSAWPAAAACVCLCALSAVLLQAYGLLHWQIISHNYSSLQDPMKHDLFRLLGYLEVYHLTALLSVAFGIWAFWGRPRWMRWVCLPFSLLSLAMLIVVM